MEKSAKGAPIIMQPVRRRLIQSTLFPHRSQSQQSIISKEKNEEIHIVDDDEDEEEGQIKTKRKFGRPKGPSSNKTSVNDKGLSEKMDNKDSPVSSKRQVKRQEQKKQQCNHSSDTCSPSKAVASMRSPRKPRKQQVNITPGKHVGINNLKEACSEQTSISQTEHASQLIPDLWLEAKMTAEENSRIFAGKQIHPFFSSQKQSKKHQEITEVEMKPSRCSVNRKNNGFTLGPIHVFDTIQDDVLSPDWRNWNFCEKPFLNSQHAQESKMSSFIQGSDKSVIFNNLRGQHQLRNVIFLDIKEECPRACTYVPSLVDENEDIGVDKVGFSLECVVDVENPVEEKQSLFLDDSMCRRTSYDNHCCNMPNAMLWTKKYQPESASEVCGNSESVKFLSEWLRLWHERDFQSIKGSVNGDRRIEQDFDPHYYESDCDSESRDEGSNLKNVLLVTGPVGSGKSAAIYACAREQGFKVIEVNTSDWRNGSLVKQKFGEAVESHRLKWLRENHRSPQNKPIKNASPALPNNESTEECDEVVELISVLDKDDHRGAREGACGRGEIKSLVLFEDVDITFIEDRGFVAAIQQLAETAKLPLILTANSNHPFLPENLDRQELFFIMPSSDELYNLVYKVCAAEKANIKPHLIEQYIQYFHGDIRKTFMHLQFWCQGKGYRKDKEVQREHGLVLFDPEAGHQLLQKIIPWDFPSQLSELIEIEISKSLSLIKDLDNENRQNDMHENKTKSLEAKKEEMLSRNLSAQNDTPCKCSDVSGSPVAFTRRNIRSKLDTVLSFSSDDELPDDICHGDSAHEETNRISLEVDLNFPPPSPQNENCINPLTNLFFHSDTQPLLPASRNFLNPSLNHTLHFENRNIQENHFHCSGLAANSHNYVSIRFDDVSCVPESSFVPESEMYGTAELSQAVSYGHIPNIVEAVSLGNERLQNISPVAAENLESMSQSHKDSGNIGNGCDVTKEPFCEEDVVDFQHEHMEASTKGYQVMDECSRMDFRKSKSVETPASGSVTDSVQETWEKLRSTGLRHYVASEQKDAFRIVKLASGIGNLISEADLLLSRLHMPQNGSWDSSRNLYEESDASHWYNEQLQMTSAVLEHGFYLYAKYLAAAGSGIGLHSEPNLAQEMVSITLSKSPQDVKSRGGISSKREMNLSLLDIVQSMVPLKSYLAVRGDSFHEYLSSLNQITRSEGSRLTVSTDTTKRRRIRVARHYLGMLSPEDISLLNQYNCYGKFSFQSAEASLR